MSKGTRRTIEITPRMAKRIRESGYQQDRKWVCLICKQSFATCEHSWMDVHRVCQIVRDIDQGPNIKVAF